MTVDGLDVFEATRGRLFGIAYRMLGSATDAEEIVQEAWLRWQTADRVSIANPGAYLAKVVTNLSLNELTSARARRETYAGDWLPEPILTGRPEFDELVAEQESVSFALLLLLERLTPAERAAYVLREAFAYSHREVADVLNTTEANARQLTTRARKHLTAATRGTPTAASGAGRDGSPSGAPASRHSTGSASPGKRPAQPLDPARWRELVGRFVAAARLGDLQALEQLLTADVVSTSDGGGKVNAARRPVVGAHNVARYLIGALERFGQGIEMFFAEANGTPVLIGADSTAVRAVCFFEFSEDRFEHLWFVMNPDKLTLVSDQLTRIGGPAGLR